MAFVTGGSRSSPVFPSLRRTLGWSGFFLTLALGALASVPWEDGTPILQELFQAVPRPSVVPTAPALAPAAPPRFRVGHRRNFFAFDFRTNRQYSVPATLRAVGEHVYVYVEDVQWNRRVNAGVVARLVQVFEEETPADPSRGIFPIETAAFGDPPDVDGDPRLVLLLLDIRDRFAPPSGSFIGGFFASVNQLQGRVRDPRYGIEFQSNETEMIYLDVNPLTPTSADGLGILAHELQHLIHYARDPDEVTWLNEAASEFAMWLCGYPPRVHRESFQRQPEVSLTAWPSGVGSSLPYYGGAYLWMLYLAEQYGGVPLIRAIVSSRQNGLESVATALRAQGVARELAAIYADWRVALLVDDPALDDGRYGFQGEEIRIQLPIFRDYPLRSERAFQEPWSALSWEFRADGTRVPLQLEVRSGGRGSSAQNVRVVGLRGGRLMNLSEPDSLSEKYGWTTSVSAFGSDLDAAVLVVTYTPGDEAALAASVEISARLGQPIRLTVFSAPNPALEGYWEIVAQSAEPITAGPMVLELATPTGPLPVPMRSLDGGRRFTAPIRAAPGPVDYRILHFGQPVAQGTVE